MKIRVDLWNLWLTFAMGKTKSVLSAGNIKFLLSLSILPVFNPC